MTDRGVSVTVNYALSLAVATILLSVLLMTTGGMIENRQQEVYRSELRVIGEGLAADVMSVDRLARVGADEVWLNVSTSRRVGGSGYSIEVLTQGGDVSLVLETHEPAVEVTVPLHNSTAVAESRVDGGDLRIHYSGGGEIEVSA